LAAVEYARAVAEATSEGRTPPVAPERAETFLDDFGRSRLEHMLLVGEAMRLVRDATAEEQQRAWFEAWGELGIGASDVSGCETQTSTTLWFWEARCVFARLWHERRFGGEWIASWDGLVENNIDPAARAAGKEATR
jgi:hypothetical protein